MRAKIALLFFVIGCAAPQDPAAQQLPSGNADGARARATATAHVIVHYPTGWGHNIAVRGSGAGLSWTQGKGATWSAGDAWLLDVQVTSAIELKPLFDDQTWAVGPNW